MDAVLQFFDVLRVMTLRNQEDPSIHRCHNQGIAFPNPEGWVMTADADRIAHIVESSIVPVAIDCISLARQVSHSEIGPSIVVVVGEV